MSLYMAKREGWVIIMTSEKIMRSRGSLKAGKVISNFMLYLVLILIAILCAGPFFWLLVTSLRPGENIYEFGFSLSSFSFENYSGLMSYIPYARYFLNTIIITVVGIALDITFSALCAYPLACMEFYGRKFIFNALISTMILPCAAGLVVNYLTIAKFGMIDKLSGVIITGAASVFSIILLRQAYMGIPKELMDAAKIDGASEIKTWYKIMIPHILPAVSTLVIFDFIGRWNAFLWPIVVLQTPEKYPLATALKYLNGMFNYKFGYIAAGTVLSIVPVIVIFLVFQKYFINTLAGAVKG